MYDQDIKDLPDEEKAKLKGEWLKEIEELGGSKRVPTVIRMKQVIKQLTTFVSVRSFPRTPLVDV
jgi:hypothetical protein